MKIQVALSNSVLNLSTILSESQLGFLHDWLVEGSLSSEYAQSVDLFKQIEKALAQYLPSEEKSTRTVFRGLNLDLQSFEAFMRTKKLAAQGSVQSWTYSKKKASNYSRGVFLSSQPFALVFRKRVLTLDVICQLWKVRKLYVAYTNESCPDNEELIVPASQYDLKNLALVEVNPRCKNSKMREEAERLLKTLSDEGVFPKSTELKINAPK